MSLLPTMEQWEIPLWMSLLLFFTSVFSSVEFGLLSLLLQVLRSVTGAEASQGGGPPSLLCNGYWVFPGGKGGRGVMPNTHPLLLPRLRKSWTIPLLTLWFLLGLLRCSLYLFTYVVNFYILFPCRSTVLHRTSDLRKLKSADLIIVLLCLKVVQIVSKFT